MSAGVQEAGRARRRGGAAASTPASRCVDTTNPRARTLAEMAGGASNVLLGTHRDILPWCTVTYPLVREGEHHSGDGFCHLR